MRLDNDLQPCAQQCNCHEEHYCAFCGLLCVCVCVCVCVRACMHACVRACVLYLQLHNTHHLCQTCLQPLHKMQWVLVWHAADLFSCMLAGSWLKMLMQTWPAFYIRQGWYIFQISTLSVTELCFVRSRAAHCLNHYSGRMRSLCWSGYWSRSHSRNDHCNNMWTIPRGT